ncbi:nodulation protein, partial [Burkholderia pseudomallei]|nr:nodulation protein [Burkholderia pseudomallei]
MGDVAGLRGGAQTNAGVMFVGMKDKPESKLSGEQVSQQLRPQLGEVAGAQPIQQRAQESLAGDRQSDAQNQLSLTGGSMAGLSMRVPIQTEVEHKDAHPAWADADVLEAALQTGGGAHGAS